jgi:hypothetical protein
MPNVVQGADARVVQRGDCPRLALEPVPQRRITTYMGRQHFDRDDAIEARVLRFVDLAHAARADGG